APHQPLPVAALGRPAAARGGGAGHRRKPADPARRRADGEPRLRQRRGGHDTASGPPPRRRHDLHGHPRPALRALRGPDHPPLRRARGRGRDRPGAQGIGTGAERGRLAVNGFGRDVRYALRGLLRAPGFTAAAVVTLALGVGANTAIFSVVDVLILKPPPGVANPDTLVWISNVRQGRLQPMSYPDYADIQNQTRIFSGVLAVSRAAAH